MKHTLIAAAILSALATGAYAGDGNCEKGCDPATLYSGTRVSTDIDEDGWVRLHGSVSVSSSAGATVNNTQSADLSDTKLEPPPQDYYSGTVKVDANKTKSWETSQGSGSKSSEHSGSFSASYSETSYDNTSQSVKTGSKESTVSGSFNKSEGDDNSGFGVQGTFSKDHTSSYADTKQSESKGGSISASYDKKKNSSWSWNESEKSSSGYVSVDVDVTHHIDTRKPTDLKAEVGNGALTDATGNIGVNIAAGVDNVQSNTVALANMEAGSVLGTAQIFSTQSSTGYGSIGDFNLVASVGDGALAGATGNVGVNVASGLGNVQNNSLALSATKMSGGDDEHHQKGGGEVIASDQNCQTADAEVKGTFMGSATLGANALFGATGNIGVNIASGAGNLQHNGLAIASVNK